MQFTKVENFTTFRAEHTFDGDDIVFHFFRTPENPTNQFWKSIFPESLSDVAMSVFNATYPRLMATYTEEVDSWWLRASGFVSVGLPEERIAKFYDQLDKNLEQKISARLPTACSPMSKTPS